jgi:hypothetical protein
MGKLYNASPATGTANTLVAGSVIAGNSLFLGSDFRKVGTLSALVSVTAATLNITFTGSWQGSNDGSTWVPLVNANNAANVTYATGTLAIKTSAFDAPTNIFSWRYARFVLTTGSQTGAAGDLYSIGYNYTQLTGSEGAYA